MQKGKTGAAAKFRRVGATYRRVGGSGKKYTRRQMKAYYATGGWARPVRTARTKRR